MRFPTGYYGQIFGRSSREAKRVAVRGGTIDTDYRGIVKVILHNQTDKPLAIKKFDKIAQLVLLRACVPEVQVVDHLDETYRGWKGFGSTDVHSIAEKWDTIILPGEIEGQKVKCLVDCGASDTYISEQMV